MQTNNHRITVQTFPYRYRETKQRTTGKTDYVAYSGIDDFLRKNPVATVDRYGDRVISGTRIC